MAKSRIFPVPSESKAHVLTMEDSIIQVQVSDTQRKVGVNTKEDLRRNSYL